jgi:hypothetical protein
MRAHRQASEMVERSRAAFVIDQAPRDAERPARRR